MGNTRAEIRLPTKELRDDLPFYTKVLKMRLDMIYPADNPEIAILSEDLAAFKKVKGVGDKTARRILVDLKDKISKGSGESPILAAPSNNTMEEEALSALLALGFPRSQAQKAISRVHDSGTGPTTVEALIRHALRALSQG